MSKKDIQNTWHDFTNWVKNLFPDDDHDGLPDFFMTAASAIKESGGAFLVDAAKAAVRAAQEQGGKGSDKFNAALLAVVAKLSDEGITFVLSTINLVIELAVAELKAEK